MILLLSQTIACQIRSELAILLFLVKPKEDQDPKEGGVFQDILSCCFLMFVLYLLVGLFCSSVCARLPWHCHLACPCRVRPWADVEICSLGSVILHLGNYGDRRAWFSAPSLPHPAH